MDITVKMLDGTSCPIRVNPQDTVGSLKLLIQQKLGVPPQRQKLVFVNGHTTDLSNDSQPVSLYGLQSGSIVSLLVIQPATIQVFLKNEKGKMSTYEVKPNETVSNFKLRVQSREGVPVQQQMLVHQSKTMTDGYKLSDYGVEALSTIELSGLTCFNVKTAAGLYCGGGFVKDVSGGFLMPFIMDITVKMLDGTSCSIRVNPQNTVGSLKLLIQQKLGVPPQRQKLVFMNGHTTDLSNDSQPVSLYGLQSGSIVSLLVTQPVTPPVTQPETQQAPVQVFLRNEKGNVSTYDVRLNETVSHFKTKVQSREGVPVSQQRLIHQGREMSEGNNKLSDYGVKALSTIDQTLRLRGG
ncbi:hypothetical protein L3Q82_006940 [Scortum barcoo]|uniref:Uncharacterized protein n=1 Tax=Scortum barcoo TaxID=214431 RepID=A0ACB8WVL4_9TELE|nr:hypothetical protein L3Q82_006940 [Scortum barcoo]